MQLLHASPTVGPEFVSLSILSKPPVPSAEETTKTSTSTSNSMATAVGMSEPMILASPNTTVSSNESIDALKQLHSHLSILLKASSFEKPGKQDKLSKLTHEFFKEDEKQLDAMQIFRPLAAHGLGLHYRLIRPDRDDPAISSLVFKLAAQILGSNKSSTASAGVATPSEISGIVFCVGMSGLPFAHSSSPLQYSLAQRMNYCTKLLSKAGVKDITGVKVLMSTFLMSDDDSRVTNEMADAANFLLISEPDEAGAKGVTSMGIKKSKPKSIKGNGAEAGVPLSLAVGSAEAARVMTQRLTVMSAVETDAFLRRYNASGQERKANLDLTGGKKSKFRRRKSDARDADFDNFDYKGPAKVTVVPQLQAAQAMPAIAKAGQKLQLRQPKKDTRAKTPGSAAPTLGAPRNDTGGGGASARRASMSSNQSGQTNQTAQTNQPAFGEAPDQFSDQFSAGQGSRSPQLASAFGQKGPSRRASTSSRIVEDEDQSVAHTFVGDSSTVASQARVQVNIALNEDLACSYKQSVLSTCSVEGVVQIQVKSNGHGRADVPFFLYLRDASMHIASMQDNKKFADDISDSLVHTKEDADHKFTVSVPKSENYFPVLRYKCVPELRPVPIRVQTRVKMEGGFCRVALQISSNPNNEASLTDLTISMGVPDEVIGESLMTQPAGGVWEEAKKSVIWCVSELGEGEKFQLQVRFEMANGMAKNSAKPDFPVLVRSQCLFAQLSDIELEVSDIPDVYPADIAMKLARRFRLAHRERA